MTIWFVNFGDCVVALDQIQGIGESGSDRCHASIFTALATYQTKKTVPEAWTTLCEAIRVINPERAPNA